MRLPLLFLVTYLTVYVSAYADAGAYERLLYYYVYKLGCAVHGGKPQKVAVDCPGKPCTFNQFVKFIDPDTRNEDTPTPDITSDEFPEIDSTARRLNDLKLTGPYTPDVIVHGQGLLNHDISGIIKSLAGFTQAHIGDVSDKMLTKGITQSAHRVLFFWRYGTSKSIMQKAPQNLKTTIDWKTTTKTLLYSYGGSDSFKFIDMPATVQANKNTVPGLQEEAEKIRAGQHAANVDSLKLFVQAAYLC